MHWERSHVNPMLALRATICNERWRELWHQALTHHRKRQVLRKSTRAKPQTPALPPGADVSSQASPPVPSAAVSEHLSPPPPVLEALQPRSCRLSRRHTRQRMNCSQHNSSDVNADICLCGRPLVRFKGHRPKQYRSDRCRQRAHRKRQATISSPCSAHRLKAAAHRKQTHKRLQPSRQPFVRKDPQTCPCGTPLARQRGHRPREYCSDRCRQRAHRERRAQGS
jgi:hypothetical protein